MAAPKRHPPLQSVLDDRHLTALRISGRSPGRILSSHGAPPDTTAEPGREQRRGRSDIREIDQ